MLSPLDPMVAQLYDDMIQAPVGTIDEEVWVLPLVLAMEKMKLDLAAWGSLTEHALNDQAQLRGVVQFKGAKFETAKGGGRGCGGGEMYT